MKKNLFALLLVLSVNGVCSAQLTIRGSHYEYPNPQGVDYLYIVNNIASIELSTNGVDAFWYELQSNGDSALIASGIDYLYPEHSKTYLVNNGSSRIASVAVIDYDSIRISSDLELHNFSVPDEQCKVAYLQLSGNITSVSYLGANGRTYTIDRAGVLTYRNLIWADTEWSDTMVVEPVEIKSTLMVDAPLCNTEFMLICDSFAYYLGVDPDTIVSETYYATAVAGHLQTITTIRGSEAENRYSNESNRPKEDNQLTGSAPLDILFKSNPNKPVATYYDWTISKGATVIVHRTEEEHRYTFTEAGTYQVKLVVSNAVCATDTMDTIITVTVSKLQVPNVFTPNGDGKNDEFRVAYESIIKFDCWVYNRWGHQVFHWNDPAKGWDGKINGRPAAVGVYYYIIKAVGADGLKYDMRGDINLIGR